ncbi:uncharacterized protein NDAI_0D00460 [Naumovozyma dairenensis CBS 421]|uniref:Uncharacterized protein n=1 Tax=Naumovozyma dairenensis (strain ATCC 10597 / BCRC 20456 / CBS 421 / NBRC 0211 / NRRL Y-12639) TaxID=1071378 RepID=G0W999_NAUDC|nr:hypothetical protein NDAI_0D00460 [Naumovozyma dairenensis CBS 421]CCD24360.1 hypothetical protein NDAI_0D00460 [Naumovozyma dairenensis CBS 421]
MRFNSKLFCFVCLSSILSVVINSTNAAPITIAANQPSLSMFYIMMLVQVYVMFQSLGACSMGWTPITATACYLSLIAAMINLLAMVLQGLDRFEEDMAIKLSASDFLLMLGIHDFKKFHKFTFGIFDVNFNLYGLDIDGSTHLNCIEFITRSNILLPKDTDVEVCVSDIGKERVRNLPHKFTKSELLKKIKKLIENEKFNDVLENPLLFYKLLWGMYGENTIQFLDELYRMVNSLRSDKWKIIHAEDSSAKKLEESIHLYSDPVLHDRELLYRFRIFR